MCGLPHPLNLLELLEAPHKAMPASSRDMNFPVLVTLGVVAAILIYVTIVSTQAWFRYEYQHEYQKKVLNRPHVWLEGIRSAQAHELQTSPVPIEQAMRQVVRAYQASSADAPAAESP